MPITNQSQRDASQIFGLGTHVIKTAANLPASTTQNIFTIAGGRVMITCLFGEVTTIIQAQACTLKITSAPTTGSAVDVTATLDINAFEAGALLVCEGDGTALIGTSTGSGFAPSLNALPFIIPTGVLRIATGATNTGATKWDLYYFPLDDGASVVSA